MQPGCGKSVAPGWQFSGTGVPDISGVQLSLLLLLPGSTMPKKGCTTAGPRAIEAAIYASKYSIFISYLAL